VTAHGQNGSGDTAVLAYRNPTGGLSGLFQSNGLDTPQCCLPLTAKFQGPLPTLLALRALR
jgi:hypothetical protein